MHSCVRVEIKKTRWCGSTVLRRRARASAERAVEWLQPPNGLARAGRSRAGTLPHCFLPCLNVGGSAINDSRHHTRRSTKYYILQRSSRWLRASTCAMMSCSMSCTSAEHEPKTRCDSTAAVVFATYTRTQDRLSLELLHGPAGSQAHTHTRTHAYTHARTHARMYACTHHNDCMTRRWVLLA